MVQPCHIQGCLQAFFLPGKKYVLILLHPHKGIDILVICPMQDHIIHVFKLHAPPRGTVLPAGRRYGHQRPNGKMILEGVISIIRIIFHLIEKVRRRNRLSAPGMACQRQPLIIHLLIEQIPWLPVISQYLPDIL